MYDPDVIFNFHATTPDQNKRCADLRVAGKALAELILKTCPDSRERSIALTDLDATIMNAVAAICRNE